MRMQRSTAPFSAPTLTELAMREPHHSGWVLIVRQISAQREPPVMLRVGAGLKRCRKTTRAASPCGSVALTRVDAYCHREPRTRPSVSSVGGPEWRLGVAPPAGVRAVGPQTALLAVTARPPRSPD